MQPGNTLLEQKVRLTALGELGWSGVADLVRVIEGLATVRCFRPVESGAAIRLDYGDAMLLGECCGSSEGQMGYEVRIRLQQRIESVTNLVNLISSIYGDSSQPLVHSSHDENVSPVVR